MQINRLTPLQRQAIKERIQYLVDSVPMNPDFVFTDWKEVANANQLFEGIEPQFCFFIQSTNFTTTNDWKNNFIEHLSLDDRVWLENELQLLKSVSEIYTKWRTE